MKNIFLTLLIFILFSCGNGAEIPNDLLPKEKLVQILIDVHVLESKIQNIRVKKDSSQLLYNTFEKEIFEKHGIERDVYDRSYRYYLEELNEMENIYKTVIDSLNLREKSVGKEEEEFEDEEQ
ncbi:MAG: DUF4296 domain-containing protein [Cyclobacteriaceae bacterium]